MKRLLSTYLYPLLVVLFLVVILKLYELHTWGYQTRQKWMNLYLKKFQSKISFQSLRKWLVLIKRVEPMMLPPIKSPDFSKLTLMEKWQYLLQKKFNQVELAYYPIIDNLTQKLSDLDTIDKKLIPDFTIEEFSFIKQWQNGEVDSKYVFDILRLQEKDFEKIAIAKITRRLSNYILHKENSTAIEYVKTVRDKLLVTTVPVYRTYLDMLLKYFRKAVEIDTPQEKMTWIEQIFKSDGTSATRIWDYTFNQTVRQIDTYVLGYNEYRYSVGSNMVAFDEDLTGGVRAIHWICGPTGYINELKNQFKVTKSMDMLEEKEYIKRIIGAFIHGEV